jgi:hypothetical protein
VDYLVAFVKMPLAEKSAAFRTLAPSRGLTAWIAAVAAHASLPRGLSVFQVQLEIGHLFPADAPVADFLIAFDVRPVVATKAAAAVLAGSDRLGTAAMKERTKLTNTRHLKRARPGRFSDLRAP